MKNSKFVLLAFAAAGLFAAEVAIAQDASQSPPQPQMGTSTANTVQSNVTPSSTLPQPSTIPSNATQEIKCYGINSCRGVGQGATSLNACNGKNSCKGKSYLMVNNQQECITKGGNLTELPQPVVPSATQPYGNQ